MAEILFIAFLAVLFIVGFLIGSKPDPHREGCDCFDCSGWSELVKANKR